MQFKRKASCGADSHFRSALNGIQGDNGRAEVNGSGRKSNALEILRHILKEK